jgi:hypothetical protein
MAGMLPIALGVGISAAVFSPGLVLDSISLWPGLIPFALALIVVAIRKGWRRRAGAIPPLLLLTWMILVIATHLAAWPPLPSSSAELVGPASFAGPITLSVHSPGSLRLAAADGVGTYRIGFVRLGGEVGIPGAEETATATGLSVSIHDEGTTEWFRYAGWRVDLDPSSPWNLSLGGDVTVDLTGLVIGSLSLDGSGTSLLGTTDRGTPVSVHGAFEISIPPGVPARVVGQAEVPPGWQPTSDGFRSPDEGDGWIIAVAEGASVVVSAA